MANLVLYRKYRPKSFAEVVGQEHIVQTLQNAVRTNLISHAYLFSGPRGSGKTTLARILAKAVNCQSANRRTTGEPCNTCENCQEINQGRAIDLIEIDAASNRGIDEIRDLKEGIKFSPTKLTYKVFVIDEAHQLTKEAANALLKTLEEPPGHAIFILATTEVHRMIPTIVSRTQRFDFRKLRVEEIVKRLENIAKKEGVKVEKPALELIAMSSEGALRDAESILDKVLTFHHGYGTKDAITAEIVKEILGIVDTNLIAEFVDFLGERKAAKAITFLNQKLEEGLNPQEFSKNIISYLRQMLFLAINPDLKSTLDASFTKEQIQKIGEQAAKFRERHLIEIIEQFMQAENKMKYSSIVQLPLELAIIDACHGEKE
ncbi:DNA polymerase III subunit gamma/tau [Patescibacteria group bacterium]|nr:DNA polymerase III subunit gamma/tau [Patescibacteria group bacterium]